MSNGSTVKRQSNIDLLKILAGLLIIGTHYAPFAYEAGAIGFGTFLSSVTNSAVDVFLLVTGFFLSQKKNVSYKKALNILIQYEVYHLIVYLIQILVGLCQFSVRGLINMMLPLSYFINLYIIMYLLSPYINRVLQELDDRQYKMLVILLLLVFSVWDSMVELVQVYTGADLRSMSAIGLGGSQGGYTIVCFIVMYILGGYIRKIYDMSNKEKITNNMFWLLIFIVSLIFIFMGKMNFDSVASGYNNPFVILNAVAMLMLFLNINIKENMVLYHLGQGTLTAYILQGFILPYVGIADTSSKGMSLLVVHFLITSMLIYLASVGINEVYTRVIAQINEKRD